MKEHLENVTVREGEAARFTCKVAGMPTPRVQWYFEDDPVSEGDIYKIEQTEDGVHSLFIPEAFPEDSGKYTAKATNMHGEVESHGILTVTGECMYPSSKVNPQGQSENPPIYVFNKYQQDILSYEYLACEVVLLEV